MSDLNRINPQELDRFITGNYGEDQFRDDDRPEDLEDSTDAAPWKRQPPCNICNQQHAGYEKAHTDAGDTTDYSANFEPQPRRCPVCGGLNPGDATHTRCTTNGYEGLE